MWVLMMVVGGECSHKSSVSKAITQTTHSTTYCTNYYTILVILHFFFICLIFLNNFVMNYYSSMLFDHIFVRCTKNKYIRIGNLETDCRFME